MAQRPRAQQGERAIYVSGVKALLKALNKIDKDLQNEVRDASNRIASDLVSGAKSSATTRQQQLAVSGLKVKRDRVPVIRVPRTQVKPGVAATDVFYGAEFGGQRRPTTMQFQPHRGRQGYFLYPTARRRGRAYAEMWIDAVDKAFEAWNYRATGRPDE